MAKSEMAKGKHSKIKISVVITTTVVVLGLLVTIYKEIYKPLKENPVLNMDVTFDKAGETKKLQCLDCKINVVNKFKSRLTILQSAYTVVGVKIIGKENLNLESGIKDIITDADSNTGIPWQVTKDIPPFVMKYATKDKETPLCYGKIIQKGELLDPEEDYSTNFLIYVPKEYDFIYIVPWIGFAKNTDNVECKVILTDKGLLDCQMCFRVKEGGEFEPDESYNKAHVALAKKNGVYVDSIFVFLFFEKIDSC